MAPSTGEADLSLTKRGCQLRQPHDQCVMLDRWVFFGAATQTKAIISLAYFSTSIGGLPLSTRSTAAVASTRR